MFAIHTFAVLYQVFDKFITADTHLDRQEIASAVMAFLQGHPREAAIKLVIDGLAGGHNLAGRLAAVEELKRLTDIDPAAIAAIATDTVPESVPLPLAALTNVHESLKTLASDAVEFAKTSASERAVVEEAKADPPGAPVVSIPLDAHMKQLAEHAEHALATAEPEHVPESLQE